MVDNFTVRCGCCGAEYSSQEKKCPHCKNNEESPSAAKLETKVNSLSKKLSALDNQLEQLLAQLSGFDMRNYKVTRFEYSYWEDNYLGFISGESADNHIRFTQIDEQQISVFANLIRMNDFVEYVCKGNLDVLIHPVLFVSDLRDIGDYDTEGTEISHWQTHFFNQKWLSQHCEREYYEEVSQWGSCFRICIGFDNGREFIAEGYRYNNEDYQDLISGLADRTEILRLLSAWGFDYENIQELFDYVDENEWKKAYRNPLELTECWIGGKIIPPEERSKYRKPYDDSYGEFDVGFADFVVRTNAFYCNAKHEVETIQASMSVLNQDGRIDKVTTMAGYCKTCRCYFLLEKDYLLLQCKGKLLCQLLTLQEYNNNGENILLGNDMKESSVLRRCGYTVNATDDLSKAQRQKILELVLENKIYTPTKLCSFLDWLISYHGRNQKRNMDAAINKWKEDRAFVQQYDVANRKHVGIRKIIR